MSALTYGDTGLSNTTSYSYRVRARDGAGTMGPYSNIATGTTPSAAPSAPSSLAATAAGSTQVSLAWGAASESGGTISQYLIERCQGAGCSAFAQVGVSGTLGFTDTGLNGSTAYSYRVRAKDGLAVLGPYSNVATATTAARGDQRAHSPQRHRRRRQPDHAASGRRRPRPAARSASTGSSAARGPAAATSPRWPPRQDSPSPMLALSAVTTYRYRIRAADAVGNVGPYSAVVQATTSLLTALVGLPGASAPGTPVPPHGPPLDAR